MTASTGAKMVLATAALAVLNNVRMRDRHAVTSWDR